MTKPEIPSNETLRLAALNSYHLLDTFSEVVYDDLTKIAALICNSPISSITLIDTDRQFLKSKVGFEGSGTTRDLSFCAHAINKPEELMIVPDSRMDPRFADNPLVTGHPHAIFYAGMPLVTTEGHALGTLCVIDNKPKTLSAEQTEALKGLARQVIQLFELRKKNDLLIKSEKQLNQFATEMEAFAYAASHDLKEPLRTVKSFVNLLKEKYDAVYDNSGKQYIQFATDAATRMEILINDLLEYSRAGRTGAVIAEADTNKIIANIKNLYRLIIAEKNVTIVTTKLPVLRAVPSAISQVFQNLIGNAIKYQPKGAHPIITVDALETATHWQFSIADNGIGILQTDLTTIFTIFKKLHSKEEYAGSGIGLAICKKIVEQHGGEIWVNSIEGKGSTFYFTVLKR